MRVQTNHLQPLRFLCADCGGALGVPGGYGPPPPVVDCASCGSLCALGQSGRVRQGLDAKPAIKVVPTGLAAVMRAL